MCTGGANEARQTAYSTATDAGQKEQLIVHAQGHTTAARRRSVAPERWIEAGLKVGDCELRAANLQYAAAGRLLVSLDHGLGQDIAGNPRKCECQRFMGPLTAAPALEHRGMQDVRASPPPPVGRTGSSHPAGPLPLISAAAALTSVKNSPARYEERTSGPEAT